MSGKSRLSRKQVAQHSLGQKSDDVIEAKKMTEFSLVDPLNGISGLGEQYDRNENNKTVSSSALHGGEMHFEQAADTQKFGETVIDYIKRKYGKEIESGTFQRIDLKRKEGKSVYSSYASWIRPGRHPEDALWPESDGQRRSHKEKLDTLSPEKRIDHVRSLGSARMKKYNKKFLTSQKKI